MSEPKVNELMEKIVSLCKRRGLVFQSSEIYGGIAGFWDYGPLGAELKRNVKDLWWRTMVHHRDDVAGLEATIIMAPQIWKASGHVDTFSDPMCDCLLTKKRFRADQVEPQSGTVHKYAGALGEGWREAWTDLLGGELPQPGAAINVADALRLMEAFQARQATTANPAWYDPAEFSMLLETGKHPEYGAKHARHFYASRRFKDPVLILGGTEEVRDSIRFNPENGAGLTEPRPFNLMLQTYVGPIQSDDAIAYLRPETAQAIFAQFKNVLETSRQRVPFGIAQTGKAFRNEVTPRNFIFRSREFEQMELEFFIRPDEAIEAICGRVATVADGSWQGQPQPDWGWEVWHKYWVEQRVRFYEELGLSRDTLEEYWQKPEELAHYARATVDILFKFPFGTQELEGVAARSDYDLSQHQRFSGKSMTVFDEELKAAWTKLEPAKQDELWRRYFEARRHYLVKAGEEPEKAAIQARADADGLAKGAYVPHVIEPSAGVDRLILALITNAFSESTDTDAKGKAETRVIMKFHPRVAPVKVGVFPLLKNKPELVAKAREVRDLLRPHVTVFYDEGGSIGRRYARQDEAGTPFGLTIDFDTLGEKPELKDTVTVRYRDDGRQERLPIGELVTWVLQRVR
ncbi:MAG: glycine--tRNA ligase [Limisphaerales bacterium]